MSATNPQDQERLDLENAIASLSGARIATGIVIEKLANVIGRIKQSGTRQMDYDNLIELTTALLGMKRLGEFMAGWHPNRIDAQQKDDNQ